MAHEVRTTVTFRDVDAMQHVNNAVYFTWMETARTTYYLKMRGSPEILDVDLIVAHASCDYRRGLRLGEEVTIRVWPSRIGTTSWDYSYELTVKGEPVAYGRTVQVAFDYAKQAKKPIAPELRRRLEAEIEDPPA
jgi:acyl-CoA thioester hydrolase